MYGHVKKRKVDAGDRILTTKYKNSKAFSDGEFVIECLVDFTATLICPENKEAVEKVPRSRRPVNRRVEDIAKNFR